MEEKTNFFEKFWYIFVIIALALLVAVIILWANNKKSLSRQESQIGQPVQQVVTQPTPTIVSDVTTANLEAQSDSDEVRDIENDINATDLTNLDKEIADIEQEINNP